jgi:hypothetical protein
MCSAGFSRAVAIFSLRVAVKALGVSVTFPTFIGLGVFLSGDYLNGTEGVYRTLGME